MNAKITTKGIENFKEGFGNPQSKNLKVHNRLKGGSISQVLVNPLTNPVLPSPTGTFPPLAVPDVFTPDLKGLISALKNGELPLSDFLSINRSEEYVKVSYRKGQSKSASFTKGKMFKKFAVHTLEEALFFENMFDNAHNQFITSLKQFQPQLSITERVIMALNKIDVTEKQITINLGISLEELRGHVFSICKKLNISATELKEFIKGFDYQLGYSVKSVSNH